MFDVDTYLRHLGYGGPTKATWQVLRDLHKRHLMTVPYDSTALRSMPASRSVSDVDLDKTFEQVVLGGGGGVCYELNGLFGRLLSHLGFEVSILRAAFRQANGSFGSDGDHVFNRVLLDGRVYLADVGFVGPSYLEPLELSEQTQHQYGCEYRVVTHGAYRLVERRARTGPWNAVYRFRPESAGIPEADPDARDTLDASESVLAGTIFRSRAVATGQLILIGKRLLEVRDGHEKMRVLLDPAEYDDVVGSILSGGRLGAADVSE